MINIKVKIINKVYRPTNIFSWNYHYITEKPVSSTRQLDIKDNIYTNDFWSAMASSYKKAYVDLANKKP